MIRASVFLVVVMTTSLATAQTPPATRPADRPVVREWAIFVSDPYHTSANAPAMFQDTLPEFIQTRRPRMAAAQALDRPMPIGVIRVSGPAGSTVDVMQLDAQFGTMLSHWPGGRVLGGVVSWRDVTIQSWQQAAAPMDERHWLFPLRAPGSQRFRVSNTSEHFVLYDVSLNFLTQLSVARGTSGETLRLAHIGYTTLRDLSIYRPDGAGAWSVASLPALAAPDGATPPRPVPAPTGQARAAQLNRTTQEAQLRQQLLVLEAQQQAFLQQGNLQPAQIDALVRSLETQRRQLEAQLPQPPAVPTIDPNAAAQRAGAIEAAMTRTGDGSLSAALLGWKQLLAPYDLPEADVEMILRTLRSQIEETGRLTAVYRMDDAELKRILPLQVSPSSIDVRRVALVVVRNIDPAIPEEIEGLIAGLGDSDWKTRESAMRKLAGIGPAARVKLQAAASNRDAEIAMRAEQLLLRIIGSPASTGGMVEQVGPGILIIR